MVYKKTRSQKKTMRHDTPKIRAKRRLISRKAKTKKVRIVARKGQPQVTARVEALKPTSVELSHISSSWIKDIGYNNDTRVATMVLINGFVYNFYDVPFSVFEGWYYAVSKGAYFNHYIRDRYKFRRVG